MEICPPGKGKAAKQRGRGLKNGGLQTNGKSVPAVARLIRTIKPAWGITGDFRSAQRYGGIHPNRGCYAGGDPGHPKGWILCRELLGYRALEPECSGFDNGGVFEREHKLEPLMGQAERSARAKGYLNFRSGISSVGSTSTASPCGTSRPGEASSERARRDAEPAAHFTCEVPPCCFSAASRPLPAFLPGMA